MKKRRLSANYMDIIFAPNPSRPWRQKAGGIVEIEMENTGFFNAVAQKFFGRPKKSQIALDEYGSKLWLLLDGQNSVYDLSSKMQVAFPSQKERMLDRVVQFLTTLEAHKFIFRK